MCNIVVEHARKLFIYFKSVILLTKQTNSGADLSLLAREAAMLALKEDLRDNTFDNENDSNNVSCKVELRHFETAFTKVFPSVSRRDELMYERVRRTIHSSRMRRIVTDEVPAVAAANTGEDNGGDGGDGGGDGRGDGIALPASSLS